MESTDTELIAHIIAGDSDEYRTLVDRHKNALYRHCFYIVRDEDLAEDMSQEAFIRAYDKLNKFDGSRASFKTWVFVIATRLCLTELRKKKSVQLKDEDYILSTYATPEQLAENREVYEAVIKLRPQYRTAITLHYWHGYSYEQIANAMDVPIGSVRGWIHRAKQQLKEVLQ